MSRCMSIMLDGIPPSLNRTAGRKNVWDYRRSKEEWTQAVWAECMRSEDRPEAPFQKAHVSIMYFFPDRRRRDADNYSGKFLLDGLTKAGVIADDDMGHISLSVYGEFNKEYPSTHIFISELEETK